MSDARTSYRSVFASRGFPSLYAGSALAMVGGSLQVLAFSVFVYDTTRDPALSSAAFAAGFLPQVLGGAVLPSIADRLPARALIPTGSLVRALVALLLALGAGGVAGGIALVAVATLVQPLFSSAQSASVSRLLTGDRYVLGRSLFTVTSMVAQLGGIAVGGATLQALGPAPALLVAAGVEAVSAVVLAVGLPSLPADARERPRWHAADTLRGYRDVLRVPLLRGLLVRWWTPLALFVGAESLAVAYAGELRADGVVTAVLIGAPPLGALLGQVLIGRLCLPATRERLVLPLLLLTGAALLPLALTPPPAVAAALLVASSVGLAYDLGGQEAFRDGLPAGREAVGFGLLGVGMMTGQGIGPLLAGPLATWITAGPAMAACGAAVLLTAVPLAGPTTVRRGRDRRQALPGPAEAGSAPAARRS